MKVLVFTGSRGEWGYLRPVLKSFSEKGVILEIVASNMHVDPVYGNTYQEIINDGFNIHEKIPMSISYDSDYAWSWCLGLLASQIPAILERSKPDLILLAGDRAETMIFASLTYYTNIPIAHIQAGELSGHKDGMARHAIGKLAHIHFASNQDAYDRLIRLGEQPFRIYLTGAPQIDDLLNEEFQKSGQGVRDYLKLKSSDKFCLCLIHGSSDDKENFSQIISEIDLLIKSKNLTRIWILPNNDKGSLKIEKEILSLNREGLRIARNLPRNQYAYLLKESKFIIGNSSSGILEAPALGTPSINIGNRQTGRMLASSVLQVPDLDISEINKAINKALKYKFKMNLIFGEGNSAEKIVQILLDINLKSEDLLNKYLND
jgi:GDP/UDP-N,N'-diacetylbacillosamine 2-epimerase (hydrolysing)